MCNTHLSIFHAVGMVLGDSTMVLSDIVPDFVQFIGFGGKKTSNQESPPKYLIILLTCPKGKVEGTVSNKGFNLNQKKGVGPGHQGSLIGSHSLKPKECLVGAGQAKNEQGKG